MYTMIRKLIALFKRKPLLINFLKGNNFDEPFVKYLTERYGADKIDIKNLRKLRQIFYEGKDFTSALGEKKFIDKVEETSANEIRNIINSEVPDMGMLNREFHFWNTVKEIAGKTLERKSGQTGGSVLTGLISGASGLASGDTMGERVQRGVIYGFLGKKAMDFLRSPAYKAVTSQAKIKLADAIASGDIQQINLILSKMIAGANNELNE